MMLWAGLGVLFVSAMCGTLFARVGWPFELFMSLLPQIGAVSLLFALCMVLLGRPGTAVLALCAVAICCWGARDMFAPRDQPVARRDLRVVWANVLEERDAFRRTIQFARDNNADVVMLAEFPSGLSETEWRMIAGDYSHHAGRPSSGGVNVTVLSRLPLSDIEPIGVSWRPNRQGMAVQVATSAGPFTLVAVHPSVPAIPIAQRARDETARVAFQRTRDAQTPTLLVGDFNTVAWAPLIQDATADGHLTRAHLGIASTWMAPVPVLGLPIDHAFAANGARISARVGPGIGSDHLPLLIDVQIGD